MSGHFVNRCAICDKEFKEHERAVIQALVEVYGAGGTLRKVQPGDNIKNPRVHVRFRSRPSCSIVHAACVSLTTGGS